MRAYDSMISFASDEDEDDEDSRKDEVHSAIDGDGKEREVNWPFLTDQFQIPSAKDRYLLTGHTGKFKMEDEGKFKTSVELIVKELEA